MNPITECLRAILQVSFSTGKNSLMCSKILSTKSAKIRLTVINEHLSFYYHSDSIYSWLFKPLV